MELTALRDRLQAALGPQFTVGGLLGQGGFAVVFRARDEKLGRDVAVKVMDVAGAPSPTLSERFVREAQTIARLEHPGIVPIYTVGETDGLLYIVMRCVDGPSLRQLLAQHGRLSVADAARISRQVADALAYAHAEGVVHRDIKPDNVLLDRHGRVLVTDFGIAKAAQAAGAAQLTTEGMIIGTPQYMSPEQASGEAVDARSDLYSLGIVLYQMLAGAPPFDSGSAATILAKQLTAQPVPIREQRADVTPALAAVLDRLLAKEPGQRFADAAAVSRAIVAALPMAARNTIQARAHRGLLSVALKWLVGLGLAGCLAFLAFVAGVAVVFWFVVGRPAAVSVAGAVPDSVAGALGARRAISAGDTLQLAFAPGGHEDTIVFVVSRRHAAVVTPHTVRRYARDSVAYAFDLDLAHGIDTRFILVLPSSRRDTVYPELPPRGAWELSRLVRGYLPEAPGSPSGVRVEGGAVRPLRIERR